MIGCPNERGEGEITFVLPDINDGSTGEITTRICDGCLKKVTDGVFHSFSLIGDIVDE